MSSIGRSLSFLLPFLLLLGAIVFVPIRILDAQGVPRYQALKSELSAVETQNAKLRREVRDLDHEVRALRTDPSTIERIARDELGMVRDGELVFQFPE